MRLVKISYKNRTPWGGIYILGNSYREVSMYDLTATPVRTQSVYIYAYSAIQFLFLD